MSSLATIAPPGTRHTADAHRRLFLSLILPALLVVLLVGVVL